MVDPIFDYQFRLILIGDSTVGKSSLLKYFTDGKFAELSDPTVGVDFFAKIIEVQDGTRIKLQLWDTAGQERFRSITKSYYRNSVGALLVYDVCNRSSFEHIPLWMMEAKRHIEPHRPVFALVGCKVDLVGIDNKNGARREVPCEEARLFAEQNGLHHVETSAKTGLNVEEAFVLVAQEVYNRIQTGEYKVEDGWDGIKTGFNRPNGMDFNLLEAETRYQNKILRIVTNAPWFVTNESLHNDLGMPLVREEIQNFTRKYSARLEDHPNPLAVKLMRDKPTNRRLKHIIPQDLI